MHYYRLSPDDVLKQVHSSAKGLSAHEAAERYEQLGANTLNLKKKESRFVAYLRQFRDLMIALLMGSALLSLYLGDIRTSAVLMALVFFNTTIGFLQEFKAEKLIESLEKLVVAKAKVLRGGKELEIASSELVVGDVVRIEAGDNVPADLRSGRQQLRQLLDLQRRVAGGGGVDLDLDVGDVRHGVNRQTLILEVSEHRECGDRRHDEEAIADGELDDAIHPHSSPASLRRSALMR